MPPCELPSPPAVTGHTSWFRRIQLDEFNDPTERAAFEASDFLKFETNDGRVDFHALRHTFITNLAESGVHPKLAKELARHSTITLTMDRYAHVGLVDISAALESLPGIPETSLGESRQMVTVETDAVSVAPKVALEPVQLTGSQELSLVPKGAEVSTSEDKELLRIRAFREPLSSLEKRPAGGVEPPTPGLQNRCSAN